MNIIELTKKLISIPSIIGSELELAKYIKDLVGEELRNVEKNRANLVSKAINNNDNPTIILNGHLDTVEITKGWSKNPFGEEQDNKLYGLGASDMKSGLAIIIDVFNKLKKNKKINLIFTASFDEEGISKGTYLLLKENDIQGDLCLIPEPSCEKIMLGCRGRYVIDLEVFGKSAHGARPQQGINAIDDAVKILSKLNKLEIREYPKISNGSICPLNINGGTKTLSVPEYCKIEIDRHVVPKESPEIILNDFKKLIETLNLKSKVKVSLQKRETPYLEPYIIDQKQVCVQKFLSSYNDFYKEKNEITFGESVGDYNLFAKRMPTIVFGPSGENWHSSDEFVYMDSIVRCRDFYLYFLRNFFKSY